MDMNLLNPNGTYRTNTLLEKNGVGGVWLVPKDSAIRAPTPTNFDVPLVFDNRWCAPPCAYVNQMEASPDYAKHKVKGKCVAASYAALLHNLWWCATGKVAPKEKFDFHRIYDFCKQIDNIPYVEGTHLLAGAQACLRLYPEFVQGYYEVAIPSTGQNDYDTAFNHFYASMVKYRGAVIVIAVDRHFNRAATEKQYAIDWEYTRENTGLHAQPVFGWNRRKNVACWGQSTWGVDTFSEGHWEMSCEQFYAQGATGNCYVLDCDMDISA